jgi:hypothetical protein
MPTESSLDEPFPLKQICVLREMEDKLLPLFVACPSVAVVPD